MKFELEIFDTLPSTNRFLLEQTSSIHGRAVLAHAQSAGIGRRGRTWLSAEGSLALSLGLELKKDERQFLPWLPFWLGVALFETTQTYLPENQTLSLKWPNDLYLGEQKLAGMLSQAREGVEGIRVVLGLGMNLAHAPQDMPEATSLAAHGVVHAPAPEIFAHALFKKLSAHNYKETAAIKILWEKHCRHIGKNIFFGDPLEKNWHEGIALGLDESGALRVRDMSGQLHSLLAEEVSLRVRV